MSDASLMIRPKKKKNTRMFVFCTRKFRQYDYHNFDQPVLESGGKETGTSGISDVFAAPNGSNLTSFSFCKTFWCSSLMLLSVSGATKTSIAVIARAFAMAIEYLCALSVTRNKKYIHTYVFLAL